MRSIQGVAIRGVHVLPLLALAGLSSCLAGDPEDLDDEELTTLAQGIDVVNGPITTTGQINSGGDLYDHDVYLHIGGVCAFETTLQSMPDTVIELRNAAGTVFGSDDDSGIGFGSRLIRTLSPGQYYLRVRGYSSSQVGSWLLTVSCGTDPVMLYEDFHAVGDAGQCGGKTGIQSAIMGAWTQTILIDSDNRSGWCDQNFAIVDPSNVLSGLLLSVTFYANGDANQCGNSGPHNIARTAGPDPSWGAPMSINTDSRGGGCWQVFQLSGRSDVALDVEFYATGDAQCANTGSRTVTNGVSQSFFIDTDNRNGGCTQRVRLRRN